MVIPTKKDTNSYVRCYLNIDLKLVRLRIIEGHFILFFMLVGIEFCSGLSDDAIRNIVRKCELGIFDMHHATDSFEIVQYCLH